MELQEYLDKDLLHSIHTSERRSFRSCRRRWSWVYRDGIYPRVTPQPLEFGVAFHAAMEKFYEPKMWKHDFMVKQGVALVQFKKSCDEQLANYTKLNGKPDAEKLEEYKQRIVLGLNMIKYYTEQISPRYDVGFTPIAVEIGFEVPILSPDGQPILCKCPRCWTKYTNHINQMKAEHPSDWTNRTVSEIEDRSYWSGLPVSYGGRIDMLAQEDKTGKYFVVDWKSTSRMLDADSQSSFLQLDDQISSYMWALSKRGVNVAGFVYVEIKKDYPRPPEELSRLYKGRAFSTSKTWMTTPEIFTTHVMQHDLMAYEAGVYDEHIQWLRAEGPRFHQRHQIHKNEYEIEQVGHNIYLEALDIIDNPRIYPSPGRFSCPSCLYRQPCLGQNSGEDYLYTLQTMFEHRPRHYYETKEPSTE